MEVDSDSLSVYVLPPLGWCVLSNLAFTGSTSLFTRVYYEKLFLIHKFAVKNCVSFSVPV